MQVFANLFTHSFQRFAFFSRRYLCMPPFFSAISLSCFLSLPICFCFCIIIVHKCISNPYSAHCYCNIQFAIQSTAAILHFVENKRQCCTISCSNISFNTCIVVCTSSGLCREIASHHFLWILFLLLNFTTKTAQVVLPGFLVKNFGIGK